ncbi:MAG: hypothetical protein ABFD81_02505, partial [Syntrophaceae bacterium]
MPLVAAFTVDQALFMPWLRVLAASVKAALNCAFSAVIFTWDVSSGILYPHERQQACDLCALD